MQNIARNLVALNQRIETACRDADRPIDSVTLIGVSKTKPVEDVIEAAALGICNFGENYLVEAIDKINATKDLNLIWHFIGRIQSNKTKDIAEHFDWVHTVDRAKIARRLDAQRTSAERLNVLIQVNIDADPAKGGVLAQDAAELLTELIQLPNLQPRGLMTILARGEGAGASYQSMAQLFADLGASLDPQQLACWDTLSMGMTDDLEAAIAAGATHIRIGTALFGARSQ